jgi:hypothetical protein
MWMLDVFCCALGCVTLLWLLSTREAKTQAARNADALAQLARTEADLLKERADWLSTKTDLERQSVRLNADMADLRATQLATARERDDNAVKLVAATADLTAAKVDLVRAAASAVKRDAEIARRQKLADDAAARLRTTEESAADLAKQLTAKAAERDELVAKSARAAEALTDVNAKLDAAAKAAKDAKSDLAAMQKTGDELAAARASIIDLQGQKAKLADKFDKLKTESESRFAGIALTGHRVVFLVDASGSMKLIDSTTPAPDKWATVADTVAKVMRSLPDLEEFQVVVFSRDARQLLGPGWQTNKGEPSVGEVRRALLAVAPDGDTNLFDALNLAFSARPTAPDTVYVFSDGLPTSGPGLTADQERTLTPTQRGEVLSKHILRTLRTAWNPPGSKRVRVNAIGFFFESPEVGAFLWSLARDNDGSFVGMSKP